MGGEEYHTTDQGDSDAAEVAVPSVDGWNNWRCFVVRETVASRVCTTWDEVLADLT